MLKFIRIRFLFILCFFLGKAFSQPIDSLRQHVVGKRDTSTVLNYIVLSNAFKSNNLDWARAFADTALQMAKSLNYKKGIVAGYYTLGTAIYDLGEPEEAMKNLLEAEKNFNEKVGRPELIAGIYNGIGLIYARMQNFTKAKEYYVKGYSISVKIGSKASVARALNNIGTLFNQQKQVDSAYFYFKRALALKLEIGDKTAIASAYANIAFFHYNYRRLDTACFYYDKSLEISLAQNDLQRIGLGYRNKGICLMQLMKLDEALELYEKSVEIAKQIGDKEGMAGGFEAIAEIYAFKKEDSKALQYLRRYVTLRDTLYNEKSQRIASDMESKYQSAVKDKELLLKEEQIKVEQASSKQKTMQRNSLFAGFAFALILAFVSFRAFRQKKKTNVEISKQKRIIEEKQNEILDSIRYAKRIQESLLPTEKYMARNLKR
jgi:tetratricopeptide (TPR) repeat protein